MTTRTPPGEVDGTWRDRVELLVTEANGASSRVLCLPFEGDDPAAAAAPPTPDRQEPRRGA